MRLNKGRRKDTSNQTGNKVSKINEIQNWIQINLIYFRIPKEIKRTMALEGKTIGNPCLRNDFLIGQKVPKNTTCKPMIKQLMGQ